LQVLNGLVNLFKGRLKPPGGQIEIPGKGRLEAFKFFFEIGDVDVLGFDNGKLGFVFESVQGGVAQQRDQRNEELRPDHIHLREVMDNIDDTSVVELPIGC